MTPKNKMPANPFDALTNAAKKQADEMKAADLVSKGRAALVMGRSAKAAFFATLAMKKKLIAQDTIETLMTDGKNIYYSPAYVAKLSIKEVIGVLCHETLHTAMGHHWRCGPRNPETWNLACDLAINPILRRAGFELPPGGIFPGAGNFAHVPDTGLSAEQIYPYLLKKKPPEGGKEASDEPGGDGGDKEADGGQEPAPGKAPPSPKAGEPSGQPGVDPGMCGGVQPPTNKSQAGLAQAQADSQMELAAAEQAGQMRGDVGADLKRVCAEVNRPKVDWREVLREFVSRRVKSDYTWSRPNRRQIANDLYLPSRSGETIGTLVLAVDCSGSIGDETLKEFAGCVEGILESWPDAHLRILYHDVPVTHRQEWTPEDGELQLEPQGGGGTSHGPVFEEIGELDEEPAAVLCLTDCVTSYPDSGGDTPVLWCVVDNPNAAPPFGQVLHIDQE